MSDTEQARPARKMPPHTRPNARGPRGPQANSVAARVLRYVLDADHPVTTGEIAKALGIKSAGVSARLCALRDRGFIERHDRAQGRGYWAFWRAPRKENE